MPLKFVFYVPRSLEGTDDVKKIEEILGKVKSFYKIQNNIQIIDKEKEEEIKSKILWHLSVVKRIGIKQTKRTKSLYPQLVIFLKEEPLTFYPQSYGKDEIKIQEFLKGLLKGEIKCLHDKYEIEDKLRAIKNERTTTKSQW